MKVTNGYVSGTKVSIIVNNKIVNNNLAVGIDSIATFQYVVPDPYSVSSINASITKNFNTSYASILNIVNNCPINVLTSFKVENISNEFLVFPNPANNDLNVWFPNSNGNYTVTIFNTLGKVVLTTKSDFKKVTIDINSLASGVYSLKISNGNREGFKKIVKQ